MAKGGRNDDSGLPFLVIYIPFHTAFTPDSQNIVSGVITAIYILIFLVILAWLLSVNDWIRHKLASKIHLNEYIIFSISECIKEIANEEAWNYPAHRRNLQQMLHNIGDLIEFDLCRKTILTRIPESVSHKKTFRLISYRFRELSYWLVSPKKDTRIALNNNLINILESYLDGDLDALVNSSIPDPPFSRIAPLNRIKLRVSVQGGTKEFWCNVSRSTLWRKDKRLCGRAQSPVSLPV